jgi:hypothetical protein
MPPRCSVLSVLGILALALGTPGCGRSGADARPAALASAAPAAPAVGAAPSDPAPPAAGPHAWSFELDGVGSPPAGFRFALTGEGREGRWVVRAVADAPSGSHVLAQIDDDPTDARYPTAVAEQPLLRDLRLSVRCRALDGEVDQAVGLVFRWQGPDDYYVTRANALEHNVRLYHVRGGRRTIIAGWDGEVVPGVWHTLAVEARADNLRVLWDGAIVIDQHDETHAAPGRVGLWTKADSVSEFDDLEREVLDGVR